MRTTSDNREPLIGKIIGGRYEVMRLIGKGGIGSVYEVRSTRLARSFAMKTLTSEAAAKPRTLERFRREADVIARLKHPNIVEIIDWESLDDGSPAIIMEYLRGEDLAKRLEGGPLAWPLLARIADEMLAAVSVAHANGIVHRDLKPENVFLAKDDAGSERVKLLDFGVSKVRDAKGFVTTDDTVIGTPAYMSPEQADGRLEDIGTHSDVWAAGAILFEMATGTVAFSAPSVPSILYKICHGSPASLLEHRPDAPPAFVELVTETFTLETSNRIADVGVLRARLRESLRDVPGVTFAEPLPVVEANLPVETNPSIDAKASVDARPSVDVKPSADAKPSVDVTPSVDEKASGDATRPLDMKASPTAVTTLADRVTSSTMMQRRKLAPVAVAMMGLAAAVVVTTVVVATRDKPARSSAAITTPSETSETPGEPIETPREATAGTPDAGVAIEAVAPAAPTNQLGVDSSRETSREPSRPAVTSTKPRKAGAPPAESASQPSGIAPPILVPATAAPHKKPCAKDDVECLYGDGT